MLEEMILSAGKSVPDVFNQKLPGSVFSDWAFHSPSMSVNIWGNRQFYEVRTLLPLTLGTLTVESPVVIVDWRSHCQSV